MASLQMTIDGKSVDGCDAPIDVINPADEDCIAQAPHASATQATQAVEAAQRRSTAARGEGCNRPSGESCSINWPI